MGASDDRPADTDPAVAETLASEQGDPSGASASASGTRDGRGLRSIRPGDTLGRYEIGEELGEGGMATVFRARDKELRREVAIKVLFPHLARRAEIVHRFQREARAAAGLEHPNILRIYDVGSSEGEDPPYIVMELIRGRSLLAELEQRGPMLSEVAACIGALLADALAAAHAAAIVHRDIKPANVMLADGGRVLLADFGVARLETEDSLVTRTGALLGTPAYMSPEQASGDLATAKSDLYSLGATLYQVATGSLPYGGSSAKVLAQIASGALVAPHKRRPAVAPELSRVICALMDLDPEKRLASAAATAAELRAVASAGGLGEPREELAAYLADPDAFVRERTPRIVSATVIAAERALADGKLPRAMALADRASALAPEDPTVSALIEKVAAGGRARSRRKLVALAGLALAVAGGGAAIATTMWSDGGPGAQDAVALAADDAGPGDAGVQVAVIADAALAAPPVDAAIATIDARSSRDDARIRVRADAGGRRPARDTTSASTSPRVLAPDAVPVDAGVRAPPVDAAPPAPGAILVKNDVYCHVTIDGVARGQVFPASARPIPVPAGTHTVTCGQPGRSSWTQEVRVNPGETSTVVGRLLETVDVRIATDVTIDGVRHAAGTTAKLRMGRRKVERAGATRFITINGPCELREDLECYAR